MSEPDNDTDLIERAWGIIANAGAGCTDGFIGWHNESSEWQEAATRWRDDYHAWLDQHYSVSPRD